MVKKTDKTSKITKKRKTNQKGGDDGCSISTSGLCSKRGYRNPEKCEMGTRGRCKRKQSSIPVNLRRGRGRGRRRTQTRGSGRGRCAINTRTNRCSKTGTATPELCTVSATGRCKKVTTRSSGRGRGRASGRSSGSGRGRGRGRAARRTKLSDALTQNCRDYIMFDDENIRNYLAEDPMNFVTKLNGNYECQNLQNLKTQHKYFGNRYKTWYECHRANNRYDLNNVNRRRKFVKIGSGLTVVKAPRWWPSGVGSTISNNRYARPTGSRVYKLVKDKKVKALVSSNVLEGDNIVSADHCNHRSDVQTYKMVEIK